LTVSINSGLTLSAAAVLLVLKPLLTALFLRAGAVGGMITPAMATGAAAGSLVALTLNQYGGAHIHLSGLALACAAGVLAITQRSPLFAALFVWELARPPYWLLLVFAVTSFSAHGLRVWRERRTAPTP
jgi:H+/Cl- antiporter ClcA